MNTTTEDKAARPVTLADCIEWLSHLDEGATIWDTDLKFIFRIQSALELLADEIDVANAAHAKERLL